MRTLILSLSLISSLFAEQQYLYEISPILGAIENGKAMGVARSKGIGIELQYNDIDFFIKPELTYIYAPNVELYDNSGDTVNTHLLTLNGVYDLEYTALLTPFIKAGVGYQSLTQHPNVTPDYFLINTGAGLKLNLVEHVALKFEVLMTLQNFKENNIFVFGGLDFAFGQEDNTPAVEVSAPVVETKVQKKPKVVIPAGPVYLSKADYNLTQETHSKQEVAQRDINKRLTSLTLFVPYLFRSYDLDDTSKDVLVNYAKELSKSDASVLIVAHTGTKGRRAFNLELSVKRAEAVKRLFIDYGVQEARIETVGKGESEAISQDQDDVSQQLNKRVEIFVTYPTKMQTPSQETVSPDPTPEAEAQ